LNCSFSKMFKSLTAPKRSMSEFVNAIDEAKKKFIEKLPRMFQEASPKHPRERLLTTVDFGGDYKFETTYRLGDSCIDKGTKGYDVAGKEDSLSHDKMTYEKFVEGCSLEDLLHVAEVLKRLGY